MVTINYTGLNIYCAWCFDVLAANLHTRWKISHCKKCRIWKLDGETTLNQHWVNVSCLLGARISITFCLLTIHFIPSIVLYFLQIYLNYTIWSYVSCTFCFHVTSWAPCTKVIIQLYIQCTIIFIILLQFNIWKKWYVTVTTVIYVINVQNTNK